MCVYNIKRGYSQSFEGCIYIPLGLNKQFHHSNIFLCLCFLTPVFLCPTRIAGPHCVPWYVVGVITLPHTISLSLSVKLLYLRNAYILYLFCYIHNMYMLGMGNRHVCCYGIDARFRTELYFIVCNYAQYNIFSGVQSKWVERPVSKKTEMRSLH